MHRTRKPHGATALRDEQGRKHCAKCDTWKPISDFSTNRITSDGLQSVCRRCRNDRVFEQMYLSGSYNSLLESQSGRCLGCDKPAGVDRFNLDHDHSCCPVPPTCGSCTRGLLCSGCNKVLGVSQDNPETLLRLAAYLKETS